MSRIIRNLTLAIGAAVLVGPVLLAAQPRQGVPPGDGRGPRPGAISHLMNARRQLDLTPRQLMQLDSLERIQYAEHQQFAARQRAARDSMQVRARGRAGDPALRDSMRAQAQTRMQAARPQMEQRRRRDSSLNVAAERVLNDTQRQKVREMQAERRGFERGLRESRGQRGAMPRAGQRGDRPVGPTGGARGMRGGMDGGMRPQQGRPQGPPPPGMRAPQAPGGPGAMPLRRPPLEEREGR